MINTHKLELPLSQTYFHGSKGVRAIEVLLYYVVYAKSIYLKNPLLLSFVETIL